MTEQVAHTEWLTLDGFKVKAEHYEAIKTLSKVFFGQTPTSMPEREARKKATMWAIRAFSEFQMQIEGRHVY